MERLLSAALFRPTEWKMVLHMPPFDFRLILRSARAWERMGSKLIPGIAGIIMIEATKEVTAPIPAHPVKVLVEVPITRPINPFHGR